MSNIKKLKQQVLFYYSKGYSIRKIVEIMGGKPSRSTINRWINEAKLKKKEDNSTIYKHMSNQLKDKIKILLLHKTEEKGKSRVLSISQIYEIIKIDLLKENINLKKQDFYEFIKYFVIREFGTLEQLEQIRRLKKEKAKYIQPKGSINRKLGLWEIDATGYIYEDINYSIMQVIDSYTGYVFPAMIVENKEKNAKHYNKAFNSLDVAYYLMKLFIEYGVPQAIKSDNERIIKNEYITNALNQLGVKHIKTKPYTPNAKLIERVFRSLKDTARLIRGIKFEGSFEDLWYKAIEHYNKESHNFKHIAGLVSPLELINSYGLGTRQEKEEEIRKAFSQRFERKITNNQIKIENLVYEFIYTNHKTELGRKKANPTVICLRDLENITNLYVYSKTGEYLGIAKLISKPANLETIKNKQIKQKQKRLQKRIQNLEAEKTKLEVEALQEDPDKPQINLEEIKEIKQEETTKEDINILDTFINSETENQEETEEIDEIDLLSKLINQEE